MEILLFAVHSAELQINSGKTKRGWGRGRDVASHTESKRPGAGAAVCQVLPWHEMSSQQKVFYTLPRIPVN